MDMRNVKQEFEKIAAEEQDTLLCIIIGPVGGWLNFHKDVPNCEAIPKGMVLSWQEGSKWIDFTCDWGYSAPKSLAIWVYGVKNVYFISQYVGSLDMNRIPRFPREGAMPEMPGGG